MLDELRFVFEFLFAWTVQGWVRLKLRCFWGCLDSQEHFSDAFFGDQEVETPKELLLGGSRLEWRFSDMSRGKKTCLVCLRRHFSQVMRYT